MKGFLPNRQARHPLRACSSFGRTGARKIVLTVTGHGLKDPDTAMTSGDYRPVEVEANFTAIRSLLENA